MKVETIEVAGIMSAFEALRLPMSLECRTESDFQMTLNGDCFGSMTNVTIDKRDLDLMSRLVAASDCEAKVVRGIIAYAKVTAPRLFWQEADTYRHGIERLSSESTMHTICSRPVTIDDFDVNDVIKEALTPNERPAPNTVLHFDTPSELKCVILEKYGRKYEVWNNGEIYACEFKTNDLMPSGNRRERVFPRTKLKLGSTRTSQGYFQVGIGGRNGRIEMIHRIMAEAFCPNPNGYNVVNHIDGDKGNCSPSNLEWCTSAHNNKHAFDTGLKKMGIRQKYLSFKNSSKYDEDDIEEWRIMKEGGMTYREISEKTGVTIGAIENHLLYGGFYNSSEYAADFKIAMKYEKTIAAINELIAFYNAERDPAILYDIKAMLPESFMQTRITAYSYQALRHIYQWRHNHRLPMWHTFCDWVKTLPLSDELILVGLKQE